MFRTIADFEKTWGRESEDTLKVLRALDDRSLGQAVGPGYRTLGRLAWHVTGTIAEMMSRTGLAVEGPADEAPVPTRAADLVSAYESSSRSLLAEIGARWDDAALLAEDEMYGNKWARGFTLLALVMHQAHHRGQMTVLMRQAGLKVPGVYGPALEEWSAFGAPAPEI
jgi:uncharacterized damage-inducible protein DinB